jgi:hypothetical protein
MESVTNYVGKIFTLNDVIELMTLRLKALQELGDHRAVFQNVYLLMTKEMNGRLSSNFFLDSEWMERVLIHFAQFYFNAMDAYEAGKSCRPPAWELSFRQASEKNGFVLQDALLGINAHINSDLPSVLHLVLSEDNAWPDARIMQRRRHDHERINNVLDSLVDLVQEELALHYARLLRPIDFIMGKKDESLSSFILTHCRTNVWYHTEQLLDAPSEEQKSEIKEKIENAAYDIGLQLVNTLPFRLFKKLAPFARKSQLF